MNQDHEQEIPLLVQNKLQSIQEISNLYKSKSLKSIQASYRMLQTRRTQEILPELKSPFLKNTVSKMFSEKRLIQLQPIIRQSILPQLRLQKSKSLMESMKFKINDVPQQIEKVPNQTKTDVKEILSQIFLPKKITKSYSETKNNAGFIELGYFQIRKSLDKIQDIQKKANKKLNRDSRSNSQESEDKLFISSQTILKKLQQLHKKQNYLSVHMKDNKSISLPNQLSKQVKSPGFVVKHKFSKQIYGSQRQQIKEMMAAIETIKGLDLSKGMSIKKYSNFFPKVIMVKN